MQAAERKVTTARSLYETTADYINSNRHSRDVNERWLCAILEPMLGTISGVMNSRPPEMDKQSIATFRAAEIEKEIASKRKEIERLERDLATAKA
jgi:hypothetical protein